MKSFESDPSAKVADSAALPTEPSSRLVEDCLVLWLLPDSSVRVETEVAKLRRIVSTVILFSDRDECRVYIQKIRVEKIFLLVPAMETFLDALRELPQLEKIYVLDASFQQVEKKIDSVLVSERFFDIDSLCKQLETDVELCGLDILLITTSAPPHDDASSVSARQQEASFRFAQLMREILYRLKFENSAKNEFVNFCRIHYAGNTEQLRIIDDFETNYRPQKALYWLTRQCFIWRVLQRMQRTLEIDILYKLGFLVKHAHTQLMIFQENHQTGTDALSTVYRGKTMFKEKFEALVKNNTGGLLSFGNFFSAHADREIGLEFIRRRLAFLPDAVGVLFEIHVDPTIHNARSPCASLDKVRADEKIEQNGIFFGMHAVFRIDLVDQFIDEVMNLDWIVRLTLLSDDDQQLLRLVAPLRSSEVHANPLSYMGKLFMEMGEYSRAEQFFLGMLQDASVRSQPRRLVRVHNGLGTNYLNKGDYIQALEQFQHAVQVSLTYLPPRHADLAPLYDAIGKSYFQQGDYQKAVENYGRAADLVGQNTQPGNDQLFSDLNTRINSAKKLMNSRP